MSDEDKFRQALEALVDRLDAVHESPVYQAVWLVAQQHIGPYKGPTYKEALDHARAVLKS